MIRRGQIRKDTMGAQSRRGQKTRRHAVNKNENNKGISNNGKSNSNNEMGAASLPPQAPLLALPCLVKLHARELGIVEEGCADVAAFALQSMQHANLLARGVPQRLAELLLTPSSAFNAAPLPAQPDGGSGNVEDHHQQQQQQSLQSEVLYMQIAAAGALRNLVVNSVEDAVVDVLASVTLSVSNPQQQQQQQPVMTFRDGLVALLMNTWGVVQSVRHDAPPAPPTVRLREGGEKNDDDDYDEEDLSQSVDKAPLVPAARALEEILQLIAVCVEGSEHIAEAFSAAPVANSLLSMLQATTSVVWDVLRHTELFLFPTNTASDRGGMWLRHYKRREAELFAAVSVAASEVLHVLCDENDALATFLQSSDAMAPHQAFLTGVLDAAEIMTWLQGESLSVATVSGFAPPPFDAVAAAAGEDLRLLAVSRQNLLYQLTEVSLRVQGTLVNCAPNTANITRALPLVVAILNAHPPHGEWCRTVPLLLQQCPLAEELRTVYVSRALWRLRCVQAAVNVLHAIVDAVCSRNEADLDDENAFQQNPQANLLQSSNAMFVVGRLMRDALRLTTNGAADESGGRDGSGATQDVSFGGHVMGGCSDNQWAQPDVVVQQALRSAAGTSGAGGLITKLQLLVLSNEVGVWSLANTLLLMVPWSGLGDAPSSIWRAIIESLSTRLRQLANDAAEVAALGEQAVTLSSSSPAATHLVWLQLESLVQMLWTLQRKQAAAAGGPLQVTNQLGACASDVDIVTRLAWESRATPLLRQACVGVVCGICSSFRSAEATSVAARFGLAVLNVDESSQTVSAAFGGSNGSLPPPPPPHTAGDERRRWLSRFTAADAQWRVRCEAANHMMDLFLDESYDAAVYAPLQVHAALKSFLALFQMYMKRRQHVARETQRNYRITLPDVDDAVHWREVADNLVAFLEYKQQHIGCSG